MSPTKEKYTLFKISAKDKKKVAIRRSEVKKKILSLKTDPQEKIIIKRKLHNLSKNLNLLTKKENESKKEKKIKNETSIYWENKQIDNTGKKTFGSFLSNRETNGKI
jgi:uncharacterized Fe-S cluster-containing radical SAM superfamily enzyme